MHTRVPGYTRRDFMLIPRVETDLSDPNLDPWGTRVQPVHWSSTVSSDKIWKSKNNFIEFCGAIEGSWPGFLCICIFSPMARSEISSKCVWNNGQLNDIWRTPLMESMFRYVSQKFINQLWFQYGGKRSSGSWIIMVRRTRSAIFGRWCSTIFLTTQIRI